MISSDAGAISNCIISPIVPSLMPTLSNATSPTLSPVSTTSNNQNHRPFPQSLLSCRDASAPTPLPVEERMKKIAKSWMVWPPSGSFLFSSMFGYHSPIVGIVFGQHGQPLHEPELPSILDTGASGLRRRDYWSAICV